MKPYLLTIGFGILILSLWEVSSQMGFVDSSLLPPATDVLERFMSLLAEKDFYLHLFATLGLMFKGFGAALLIGIPLGVLMGLFKIADYSLSLIFSELCPQPL